MLPRQSVVYNAALTEIFIVLPSKIERLSVCSGQYRDFGKIIMTMNRKRVLLKFLGTIAVLLSLSSGSLVLCVSADKRQEVTRLAELLQWMPGSVVADIGAGDGSYSFLLAEKVGASGRVYATEIDMEKLKSLRTQVTKRKLDNIIVIEGAASDTNLPSGCCDSIFLRHVYHHITQPQDFDRNLVRALKSGARLAIIDFPPGRLSDTVKGVPSNRGGHGIPQKVMVEELKSAGLQVEKVIDDWSGDDYCVLFVKRGQ
jgi:ubiquinone/menaquinone biosynthesis C-methylase UbiE